MRNRNESPLIRSFIDPSSSLGSETSSLAHSCSAPMLSKHRFERQRAASRRVPIMNGDFALTEGCALREGQRELRTWDEAAGAQCRNHASDGVVKGSRAGGTGFSGGGRTTGDSVR